MFARFLAHRSSARAAVLAVVAVASLLTVQCSSGGSGTSSPTSPTIPGPSPPNPTPPAGGPETFVGAGDIGMCSGSPDATARQLDTIGGTVFTLGDNAYMSGSQTDFRDCYDPSWGRHKARTRPAPGNHDYGTPGAAPYFDYFGASAGPWGLGYYSFNVGAWHVISLNSNISGAAASAQTAWLRGDVAANAATRCTLAYWHHPLYSSGPNGNNESVREMYRILYDANADLVMSGHDHLYERFGPQDADGRLDTVRGIREFIVGTGGATLYDFASVQPNSEVRLKTFGVLRLTLSSDRYQWEFISTSGAGDSGAQACH